MHELYKYIQKLCNISQTHEPDLRQLITTGIMSFISSSVILWFFKLKEQ